MEDVSPEEMAAPDGEGLSASQRTRRIATHVALLLLLASHYSLRRHADAAIDLHHRSFYAEDYVVAISLAAGRGFHGFDLKGEQATWPEAPTVLRFLAGDKQELREGRLQVFLDTARSSPPPAQAYGRILDLHTAGLLWRAFGISWPVLFEFYAGVSTLACLGVFLLGRRLGGPAAGLLSAMLFVASPFEATYAVYSIRDISPLWFAIATALSASRAGRVGSPRWALAAAAAAGGIAAMGIGWRPDALLFPPLGALILAGTLAARRVPPAGIAAGLLAFGLAAFGTWSGIERLGGGNVRRPPTIGFHIAVYGDHTRSNLLDYENSFLAIRDDSQTFFNVAYSADAMAARRGLVFGDARYAEECRRVFAAMARSEVYRWVTRFPRFFRLALVAFGDPASIQSIAASDIARLRPASLGLLSTWILDPLARMLPALFAAGALVSLACGRDRVLAAALAGWSVAYAVALLTVLPESKHFGAMLLSMCVLGGQAARIAELSRWLARWRPGRRAARAVAAAAVLLAVMALVARLAATKERGRYLADIRQLLASAPAAPAGVVEAKKFTGAWHGAGGDADAVGLAVEVATGDQPGDLVLRQERGRDDEPSHRVSVTRHALPPGRNVTFFVTAVQGTAYGDIRSLRCVVEVGGTATILAARQLGLAGWHHPPFAAVVGPGLGGPGNPELRPGAAATQIISERVAKRID